MGDELLPVRIIGPSVTVERAREVGRAAADLFNEVARAMGAEGDVVAYEGEVRIACDADGCAASRAWGSTGDGWLRAEDGRDYCPAHAPWDDETEASR